MQLDTPRGLRRYTHFHIKDPEQMLCPEYFRIGHESDYVQDLVSKLNQPERHEIEFTDMMNEEPVAIKAQVNIHFSMPAFVPNMNYEAVYYLVNKLEWSNEIKVLRKSSTRREKIRPWEVHKMVTELVQAHPEYEEQMYRFHFSFLSKRNIRALIIVLARKGEYMDEALTKLMNRWIVKGEENAKFRWPGTQVPAIRIVPLFVTHLAIYNVGDTAVVEVEPHEIHDEVRYCQKRLFKEQEYERNLRMSCAAGSNKFYIHSVQVEDSGMYKCETPTIHSDPHILIQDHYIIVLPRKTDVTAYVTVQMPTEEDNLENTYPYKDSLDRFYFKQNQPIIITCVYNLSKGLDNYLGYGEAYRTTNPVRHMNYQVLGGHTRSMGNMFLNITSYQVMPEYAGEDQVLETQFQCSYLYEQTLSPVRHAEPIRYEDRFIHTEVTLVAVKNRRPLTISSTIQTNVRALTHGLSRVESTFSNLSAYLHTTVRVPETMVIGTFVGLLSEYDGWGQVWLIQKEKNATSYYSRECRTKWHKVITTKTSAWLHAPEMHLSHSLVTVQFEFSCIFDLHTEAIVFTLLNEDDNLVTRNEVAQNFRHSIIQTVTALNKAQEYVPTELTRLVEQTTSHIRLIQTTVGWRATLNISDRVHMMWRVSKKFQNFPVHCSYQVNRTRPKELLPGGFSIFQKSSGAIVELSKRSAEITDSGWYRCYIRKCVKCTTELLGPERHLVVLPNESQLKAQVELEDKLIDADNVNTKLNPIMTEEMKLFVHCSYWMYYGLEANITLGFRYETGIPRSMDQLSLPYKYLRTIRTESNNQYRLKQIYSIDRPDADVYWKYTNATCFMYISNVIRDEKDVFETDFFLHVTKSIYFNYNLTRFPRFLPQFIQTSSEGLTRSLQQNESTSLEYLFTGNRSIRPVSVYEAGYQLNWTLFLGIPLGWTNVWTIYRKKETMLIEPCNNLVLIKLHDATEMNNLTAMSLYKTNAGINFYNASADCNLQPEHSGLIISAFSQRSFDNEEDVEKAFMEEIKRWFSGVGQNVSYASAFRKMNYHVTYRAVVIEVHWRASVRIGDVIMMVGRRSGTQGMPVCQYRETVDRDATPIKTSVFVVCTRFPPIKRLEAVSLFSYRMEHPKRRKYLTLDVHKGTSFSSTINDTRVMTADYEITSPSAEMYAGELHFACRLNYVKFVVTSNDLDIPTGRLEVQTEKVLSVRILVPPSILPYSLKSDHPDLFQNWRFHNGLNMSAFQFWHSASTNRFPESYVTFSIVVGLGVPAGWVEVWTYVAYKKMLLLDECEDILLEEINSSHAPKSAHFQEEFRKARGRNFVNVTAGCIMHPEHLALAIVSYHSGKNRSTKDQIKEKLHSFTRDNIDWFLSNPTDTTFFVWKRFEDSGVAMGLLKLNIGWKASVKKGESISMLVRCARPLPAFVSIKYRETATSRSVVIARLKCYNPSVYYTRKAAHTDSGVYVCISVSNCLTCGIKQCFQQRILVVLPDETMTHMFLRRQLVQSTENISSDFLQSNLSTGETLYVYCAQLHPKGLVIQIEETFDYQFLDVSNKSIIILDRTRHPVLVKPIKRGSVHYTPYQITGPPANYESGRLLIRCVAKMDRKNIDPRDVRPLNRIEPVIRSMLLESTFRVEPVIFTTLVSANWIQLQNHLRSALKKMSKSVEFSQPARLLPEGVYRISSIASLGSPRGIQNAWTFYRKDSNFAFEQCHIRSQVNLTTETSPRLLTWHNEYKTIHKDSLVNTTFKCVIRSEHEGLALVSYSVLSSSLDFDSVKLQFMKSLAQWIQFTVGHPSDRTDRNIPVPTGSMITYALARLTVGWQAFPNMNEPIRMLGSLDKEPNNQIQCFYQTDMSQIPEVVGNSFQIVIDKTSLAFWLMKKHATFTDSGIYTCKVSVSQCDQCIPKPGFIRRRLQVRPDSSVLQLLLTHTQLEKNDNWQTFYSHVDTDGQLYMYTEIPIYAHCLYQAPAGSMLKPYATLHFSAMDENSENCLLTQRLVSTHIKEQNVMQSYYLTASEMDGQTGLVKVACELRYQAADSMRQSLDTTPTNIQLDAIVTLQLRRFLRPHIFFPLTKMKNKTFESLFHRMEDSETNVKQFHSVQNQIRTEESILTVNVLVSLGIPRGRFTSWIYVRQKDSGFIRENCFIEKILNVTRSEVPLNMYTDQLYKSVRAGCLVNVTMHCVLRPEHVALTLLVHNTEGSNQEKTESILEQRVRESLQAILGIENSDRQVNETTNLLQGVTVNFRMIRLVVQWLELRKIGSAVQMLGYVGKTENREINCFMQAKPDDLRKPVGPAFHIVRILNGFAFYLIKTSIEFNDSGDYWCTVSEKCRNCTVRFGFLPRRLFVVPDKSILEILINHNKFESNTRMTVNFTQHTSTNEPYLFNGQTAYVYCRYPELKVPLVKTSFEFRYVAVYPEKNMVIKQPSIYMAEVKRDVLDDDRIVHGFLIQAPMKAETGLYLNVTCTVKYTRELPPKLKNNSKDDSVDAFVVSQSQNIVFYSRSRPRLFASHIGSSNKNIQQAFRFQEGRTIVRAREFHQSGPKGRILEGLVQVSTLLTLGSPEGIPSVKLLYGDNILRADRCKTNKLEKLQSYEIPHDVKTISDYLSDEELSVFYYSASCRLTSSHMAIIIMVINSFDLSANPRALEWTATMSIIKGVTHWMKNRYDLKEVIIRPPPNSYLDYAVSKILVGWRATIVTGEPMVIFGLLGPSGEGNPICQFYDSSKLGVPSKIINRDTKEFILAINRTTATFELIKPVALERDGGIYSCQLLDCAQCSTKEEFPERELIVFSDQMKLFLHYTFKPYKNNLAPPSDIYNQLSKEGVPFIYTAQTIFVHCECRAGVGTKVSIGFRFQFREYSDTKPPMDLPYEISSDTFRDLADQWSYIKTYRISGPKPHSSNGRLETLCELYHDYDRIKIDVNHEIGSDIEIRRRVLNLVVPVHPYIMSETIWTKHNELTTILQWKAAKEPNSFTFMGRVNREPVEEGPFRVSVTVNLGRPSGWSAVWVLVNRSSVYRAKPCIQIKEEIPEIPGKTVEQTNILNRTYECYIQPEYFAILIYALQVPDVEFDRKPIEGTFVQSALDIVAKWFENPSDSEQRLLQLPARSFGTYLLCRISVAWRASVPLHSPIQMFGVLDEDSKDPIVCQYGSRGADRPLVEDSGFEILRNRSYFYLWKPEAQFHDSGIYECRLKACSSCPGRFGLPSRQLLILPESSIVDFRFDSIRRGTKGDDCGVPSVPLISPGEGVIVSCKYSIPKGSLRKTTSKLYLKKSEANDIEHQLQNVLLNLQKEGPIILVERTVTIPIPQQTQQSKQWRIRCEVVFQAYRVPQDIVPEIPVQVVNQFLQFTPVEQRHVNVFVHTFSTNIGEVTQVLRNTDLTRPNKASFLAQSASSRIQEGVLTVKYLTDMGSPPGWTIAWMIYRQNDKLEKDECLLDPVNKSFASKRNMNKYYCSLIPGHVTLLVGALQISGSNWTREIAEQNLETQLLSNLTEWLQMRRNEASEIKHSACFNRDLRLLRLDVGWKATVHVGNTIIMMGRLSSPTIGNVHCFYGASNSNVTTNLSELFTISIGNAPNVFRLTKYDADYKDSGWYSCSLDDSNESSLIVGMKTRRLIVLPQESSLNCKLTLDQSGNHLPVPLGTEFVCSGGHGLPRLTYKWLRVSPPLYKGTMEDFELASWLPGQRGGWDGPELPFTDMPSYALQSDGPILRVPKNDKYKGMNYFYICKGSNIVRAKESVIRKALHIPILICYSDGIMADYVIFMSQRLMAACSIRNSPDNQIQFYGYFFNALIFDPINGVTYQLSFAEGNIVRVRLRPVMWLSTELKAASFECSVQGTGTNLVAELLVQRNTNGEGGHKRYEIIGRKSLTISVFGRVDPVNLTWLEVPEHFDQNEVICLVRPDSKSVRKERYLDSLPVPTRLIRASTPIKNLTVMPQCPAPPLIKVKTHLSKLRLGSRFEASCVAATTADGLPLKLYYLTPKLSIIICTKMPVKSDGSGIPVAVPAPCESTTSHDKDCTAYQYVDRTYYPTRCEAVQRTEHKTLIRTIRFAITKLRPEDMDGRLFCQTINVYSMWSSVEQFRAPRLYSRVHVMRFKLKPQIWSFIFFPELQEWTCTVLAYPMYTEPLIRLLHATPVYLQTQLEVYSSSVNMTQPTIMNAHLLPTTNGRGSATENEGSYYARIKFHPDTFKQGGLRYGNATLSCSFDGFTKVLVTRLGEKKPAYEPLMQKHLVTKAGRQVEFICSAVSIGRYRASQISLVRKMSDNAINKTIVGDKKHMAFGQRLLSNSLTFRPNEIRSILVGHLLHLRCIAWSTIPSERRLEQFYMFPQNRAIGSNRTTKDNPIQSAIVISQIDHYQLISQDSELHHVGCLMTDGKRESQILLPGPKAECEAPNDLRWYPDDQFSHSQSSEIVCNTKVGCSQPQFEWRWIAGPVPQITHVEDQTYRIVEPGPVLNLSRLPRSGTYVFRCTVTCLCSDGLKTQSIQASFHVHLEDTASAGRRESDPSLDGLDKNITLVSRPEDTTISGADSDLQQKSHKEWKNKDEIKALNTFYADSKEMESYCTTLLQRHKNHECLEDLKNQFESSIQQEPISLFNLLLDSPRLKESAEVTCEENSKFLPYKTEYLGYAIRPTYDFRSRIVRGCNRFMSSAGEPCPRNFDYYTEISNSDVAGEQRITDAIIQGLAYMHISGEVQRQNQGEKRNTELFDDLTKGLCVYFLNCIKRQQQPNKVSQIYLEKPKVSETPTRRLKHSLNEPGNVIFRTDKNLLADIHAVSDGALCGERCSPREQAKHQREVIQGLSEVDFKMELVPLGYRESLFGRGGLEDTRWDDMRAYRERERRKFVRIGKDDKSPPNPELLNSLDLFKDQSREVERGAVESKGRRLLHLHDWNQHLSRTPVDRLGNTDRKTVRSEYTEELFDRKASNDPIHMNEQFSGDFTDNRIRLPTDNLRKSNRFFDFVNETMSAVHRGFPTNFGHFDWTWLNFPRKFVSRSRDRLLSEIQNDEREEEEKREYLRVEPGLVKLPSTTTAICPISAVPKGGNYRLAKLMWLRLPHANSLHDRDLNEVEEIIHLGMDMREIKPLLLRFNSPNRVYAYPPKRWTDAFTLDITNLNINDFGFYACVVTFEVGENLTNFFDVTKRARYPLCIIPNQPRPKLHVTRAIGGLVNQSDEVVDCLSPDEEIFLSCEVEPFQIFCEKSDHLANGSLLFDTKFYGHVFLTEFDRRTRRMNLQSTNNSIRQPFALVKRHFQTKHHTWGLRLTPEHDGAYVDCEVLPHLVLPPYGMPNYWDWLARRLKKFGMKKLRRVSKPLKLCIEPLTNPVRIYPEPQSHYARPFRLLALPPQQMLACRAHQVPMVYPNLSIFPIVDGSIEKALMHGLNQSQFWVDQNKMPEFILEVYPPATEFWVDFEISKSWLIIILPAGFILYAALKRCSRQRRTTTKTHSSPSVDSTRKTTVSHKSDLMD
ncbi:hypothetical protein FGIG_00819 [Fasciola gigantica]|uniref:Ig-like domain-containing protein n=1 Tax=Fasciola gigantica TaxID=46835 RepID=A0A504YNE5_FASGI|nr:hypothetical protein FGIG_00819 [Fasciola gigantica]